MSRPINPEREGQFGFTIIELMVVITVIVIVALIAVPSLINARLTANEAAAIETLRSICTAQSQFRTSGKADEDGDSQGEHGSFGELSGAVGVRGGLVKTPTDLTGSIRLISTAGEVERSGYIFRMYLPDSSGEGVREMAGGGFPLGSLGPNLCESFYVCYAWPGRYGVSGRRTFVVSQYGDIRFADDSALSGTDCPSIRAGISFLTTNLDSQTGIPAVSRIGSDGRMWRVLR